MLVYQKVEAVAASVQFCAQAFVASPAGSGQRLDLRKSHGGRRG